MCGVTVTSRGNPADSMCDCFPRYCGVCVFIAQSVGVLCVHCSVCRRFVCSLLSLSAFCVFIAQSVGVLCVHCSVCRRFRYADKHAVRTARYTPYSLLLVPVTASAVLAVERDKKIKYFNYSERKTVKYTCTVYAYRMVFVLDGLSG